MTSHPLPAYVQRFFTERLANQLGASHNTVASYRDTFLLLLTFAAGCFVRQPTDLLVTDIDADLVGRFLDFLETKRGNSARSRNARLTAIRSFFKYVSTSEPQLLHHCHQVLALPAKRHEKRTIAYLDRNETEALLAAPDLKTWYGRRNRTLLLLCAQTGLRVSELIDLNCSDVNLGTGAHVKCRGQGPKGPRHTAPEEHREGAPDLVGGAWRMTSRCSSAIVAVVSAVTRSSASSTRMSRSHPIAAGR